MTEIWASNTVGGVLLDVQKELDKFDHLFPAIRHLYAIAPYDVRISKYETNKARLERQLLALRERVSHQTYGPDYPHLGKLL